MSRFLYMDDNDQQIPVSKERFKELLGIEDTVPDPDPVTELEISAVEIEAQYHDAVIGWETNVDAACEILINGTTYKSGGGTSHEVSVVGLQAGSLYEFVISGKTSEDQVASENGTFATKRLITPDPGSHDYFNNLINSGALSHHVSWRGHQSDWWTQYSKFQYANGRIPEYNEQHDALEVIADHEAFPQVREMDFPQLKGNTFFCLEMMINAVPFTQWPSGYSSKLLRTEDNSEEYKNSDDPNRDQRRFTMNIGYGESNPPFYFRDGHYLRQFDVATGKTFDHKRREVRHYYSDSRGDVPSNWEDYPDKQPGGEFSAFRNNEFPHPDGSTIYTDLVGNQVMGTYRWEPNVFYRILVNQDFTNGKFVVWAKKLDGKERAYKVVDFAFPDAIPYDLGFNAAGFWLHSSQRSGGNWQPVPKASFFIRNMFVTNKTIITID